MQAPPSQRHVRSSAGPLLEKGDLVAGRYRVERVIGGGTSGQVVAARHIELGNLFAIKVLRGAEDEQQALRFMREAQAIARIQNDHVVRVHDVGQTERGVPYLVMEHLDGQDLGALLTARGPLPVDEAVGAVLEACEGLAHAHAIGIAHRDLKPSNLFLARKSASGAAAVKVVDFGLAKSTTTSNGHILSAKATANGELGGTAGYLAPEQMNGDATARSDVWSLGVTLYRLLTNKHPFAGKNAVEISLAALTADFRPLEYFRQDVPPAIEAVIARCLRKIPEERYADARALHDALLDAFSYAPMPQSQTEATMARATPRSANAFVVARDAEPTIITRPGVDVTPSGPPPTTFTTSEEGMSLSALDRRSRLMLVWSGVALAAAVLFLLGAIAWRRSAHEARRERERAMELGAQPAPPLPAPTPPPPEVVTPPPAPAPVPVPREPEPPVAVASVAPPEPPPPAEPAPAAPVETAPPAKKPPVKKKALYETP